MKALTSAVVLFALILTSIFSCQRDISGGPEGPKPPEKETVTASIAGRITDKDNKPVLGAQVRASSGAITSTDINGNFRFTNISVDKNAGFVLVEKDGFFQGSRTIVSGEGSTNYVTIQLIKKTVAGTVSGSTGGTVTIPSGGTIALPANGVINTATNAPYTGTVSVSAFFLNPTDAAFTAYMPGALRGLTTNNEERALESFGMLAVELNGAGNEKLQLANGRNATLSFPIPATLQATAPASIPLWFFSDSSGLWMEQGSATKQGTSYVGTVSHFSFWNCDWPNPVVDFKVVVKDQNGKGIYPARLRLEMAGESVAAEGWTDSSGSVSGKVPKGKTFELSIYNKCGTQIHVANIGPFTSDADLGTLTINRSNGMEVTISGTVVGCSAAPVTNGFVDIAVDNLFHRVAITNGAFSTTILRCEATPVTAVVTPTDVANSVAGTPKNVQITSTTANAGQLTACGTSTAEFVNFKFDGTDYSYATPTDSVTMSGQPGLYTIWAIKSSNNDDVSVRFAASATGPTPLTGSSIRFGNSSYFHEGSITVNITEFGAVGGYVAGNLAGNFKQGDSSAAPVIVPVTLSFRAKRTR